MFDHLSVHSIVPADIRPALSEHTRLRPLVKSFLPTKSFNSPKPPSHVFCRCVETRISASTRGFDDVCTACPHKIKFRGLRQGEKPLYLATTLVVSDARSRFLLGLGVKELWRRQRKHMRIIRVVAGWEFGILGLDHQDCET